MSLNARSFPETNGNYADPVDTARILGTEAVHVFNALWAVPRVHWRDDDRRAPTDSQLSEIWACTVSDHPHVRSADGHRCDQGPSDRSGKISDDVELVNIWPELRARTESGLTALKGESLRAPVPPEDGEVDSPPSTMCSATRGPERSPDATIGERTEASWSLTSRIRSSADGSSCIRRTDCR